MHTTIIPIVLRVPRHDIAYVKFVIESYEGVAVTRTLDRQAGDVVVMVAPDFLDDAFRIVTALEAEGACRQIATPPGTEIDCLGPDDASTIPGEENIA